MAQPSRSTVTIDGNSFRALTTDFGISTENSGHGMPLMGSLACAIDLQVDINDTVNMPFTTLRKLFEMANIVTRDKIRDIRIEFWLDENRTDVVCAYSFQGWISRFHINSSGEANHTLSLSLEPALMKDQYHKFDMTN